MKKKEIRCKVADLGVPVDISQGTYQKILAMAGNDPIAVSAFINDALKLHFDSFEFVLSEELSDRVTMLEKKLKEKGDACHECI